MHRLGQCVVRNCRAHISRYQPRSHLKPGWHPRKQFGSSATLCEDEKHKLVIRHFEQVGPRETDLREVKEEEQEALSARLTQLENALEKIQSMEDAAKEVAPARDFEVRFELPKDLSAHIKEFNRLVNVYRSPELLTNIDESSKALWKQYLRCKEWVPTFTEQIPDMVWRLLWEVNYHTPQESENRARRLWTLAEDMAQVKKDLSPVQRMVRIESRFAHGEYDKALRWWTFERKELENNEEVASEFCELGIRTAVVAGKPELAMQLICGSRFHLKAQHVVPLIVDRLRRGGEANAKVAWALYLDLRLRMGKDITPEDFDRVVMCFLDNGRPDLALAAFKDLVLYKVKSDDDSVKLLEKSQIMFEELQKRSENLKDLTEVSLTALAYLPRRFANGYFYASWMKRLIGMGRTDSVGSVLQLMYERGIQPGPKHINGFMSALLRGKDLKDKEVAIQIGWNMIRERLKFVARRRGATSPTFVDAPDPGLLVPPYLSRNLPPATIETFCILLLHYEIMNMQQSVEMLKQALLAAEIPPDCYFMNHLIYTELRKGDLEAAWKIFDKRKGVKPDLETFAALWDCERRLIASRGQYSQGFPAPRALFSTMMNWQSNLTGRARQTALEEFSQDLYLQIIRCICYHRDPGGTLVALYALKETFNAYPDDAAVRLITIQMARLGERKTTPRHRRVRFSEVRDSRAKLEAVTKAMESITEQRTEELRAQGIDPEKLVEEQRREEVLYRTALLLRIFIRHHEGLEIAEESTKEKIIEEIAWEMGSGALHMEPPIYSGPPAMVSGQGQA